MPQKILFWVHIAFGDSWSLPLEVIVDSQYKVEGSIREKTFNRDKVALNIIQKRSEILSKCKFSNRLIRNQK